MHATISPPREGFGFGLFRKSLPQVRARWDEGAASDRDVSRFRDGKGERGTRTPAGSFQVGLGDWGIGGRVKCSGQPQSQLTTLDGGAAPSDRKSTRLNSSH